MRQSRINERLSNRIENMQIDYKQKDSKVRVLRLNSCLVAELDLLQRAMPPTNSPKGANLFSMVSSPMERARKEKDEWTIVESQIPHKFLPFCRYVFLNMGSILVLGGLDDTHQTLTDFFTNYCYELKVLKFQANDEMYVSNPRSSMLNGRGCFAICLNENFVFVFGGVVGID